MTKHPWPGHFFGGDEDRIPIANSKEAQATGAECAAGGPLFEELEDRRVLAVLTVNSLADNTTGGDGLVTLREAIIASNTDTITDLGETGSGRRHDPVLTRAHRHDHVRRRHATFDHRFGDDRRSGHSRNLSINGAAASRIFNITEEAGDVSLSGMTLTNGNAGVGNGGGAIFSKQFGLLSIANSAITGNAATFGGGIYVSGDLTLTNTTIGGIGALTNTAENGGGGIFSYRNVTLKNSTISGNTAGAAGRWHPHYGNVTLVNSTDRRHGRGAGNTASATGGGIYGVGVNLPNSTVTGNSADATAAVSMPTGDVTVKLSTVSGNTAAGGGGGGIYAK